MSGVKKNLKKGPRLALGSARITNDKSQMTNRSRSGDKAQDLSSVICHFVIPGEPKASRKLKAPNEKRFVGLDRSSSIDKLRCIWPLPGSGFCRVSSPFWQSNPWGRSKLVGEVLRPQQLRRCLG